MMQNPVTWHGIADTETSRPTQAFPPLRFLATGVSLCVLTCVSLLYTIDRALYHRVLTWWMAGPYKTPFLDFEWIFAINTCWRHGIDVYATNPCDQLDRLMNYSPLWLRFGFLDVDRNWAMPGGVCFAILLCLSLSFMPVAARWRDQGVICLAALSSVSAFGIERGNMDVLVTLLAFCGGIVLTRSAWIRALGYATLLLAALLKFYPLVALLAVVREKTKAAIAAGFFLLGIAALLAVTHAHELGRALKNVSPVPLASPFGDSIGAVLLPSGLPYALHTLLGYGAWTDASVAQVSFPLASTASLLILIGLAAGIVWLLAASGAIRQAVAGLPAQAACLLLIGAVLMVGCFFTGRSVCYRAMLLLLVLPGLLCLDRPALPMTSRWLARVTIVAMLIVMYRLVPYGVFERRHLSAVNAPLVALLWFGFELLWWWIAAVLGGLLVCVVLESPAWRGKKGLLF